MNVGRVDQITRAGNAEDAKDQNPPHANGRQGIELLFQRRKKRLRAINCWPASVFLQVIRPPAPCPCLCARKIGLAASGEIDAQECGNRVLEIPRLVGHKRL